MQKFKNIVFVIISTLVLANCGGGGGGGGSEPAPVPTPPPAPTASISANPTTLWVNESVTLTWSSTNATGCSAGGEWSGDNKDPSGEESVTVTKDGELTYSITCSSGTRSATSEVVITANPINQTGKYTNEDGTYVYIEAEQGNLFNTPAKWTYSLREHGGYTYPNSETGEPIILDGGWYDNRIKTCRSADLNGDEYPDVVAQSVWNWQAQPTSQPEDMLNPERRPRVHFFINDGQGKFSDAQDIILGEDYYRMNTYKDLAIGDLNNDGLDDIITPSGSGGVLLWQVVDDGILLLMSNAEGKYEDKTSLINFPRITRDRGDFTEEVLGLGGAEGIGIIDVNSDGWKDIVMFTIAQPEQGYRFPLVLLNNEGESFEPWDRYKNDNSPFLFTEWVAMRDAQVADFDNDGDEDMFLLCYTDCWRESSSLYEAGSNTGFVLINDEGDFNKENIVHFPEGTLSDVNKNDAMSVGDINGDGLVDIVIAQGKSDPYYVSRNIQILINTGEGFSDETEARIENLRNDFNGHPEGNIFLIDYDNDGDLDIFDYQDNVRNGYSTSNNNAPTEEDKKFPYWKNGGALFLNDGGGIFTYQEEDTTTTGELPNLFEPWKMATFNEPYHICPVDFGEGYGYGFGFSGGPGEEAPNVNPPEGEPYVDYNLEGFAFGRKVSNQDNFRQE
jgi:hypothetical protein